MKPPKNDDKFYWTRHVADKMRYYGISESLIKRIFGIRNDWKKSGSRHFCRNDAGRLRKTAAGNLGNVQKNVKRKLKAQNY